MAARTKHHPQKQADASKPAAIAQLRTGPDSKSRQESNAIPIWEWIVAALGLVIVTGVLGFLLYEALGGNQLPPDVKLSVDSVAQTGNGYLVKITAVNQGGSTAEGVIVEGQLKNGTEPVERSQTTLEYLPPHSKKRAGLFFTRDPRQFELQVRPFGYEEP
jgi:uncharacterized protein (TIGR02588 family)